jgi:hypothetical protein
MSERPPSPAFGPATETLRGARGVVLAALLALAGWSNAPAAADVFKCVENGRTSYQDQPCRGQAGVVRIGEGPTAERAAAANEEVARLKASVAALEQARRGREAAAAIEGIEREIDGYDKAEQAELAVLRAKQAYASQNLNGAVWERAGFEQGLEKEMQSVGERYAAKRQAARGRIEQLQKDAAAGGAANAAR